PASAAMAEKQSPVDYGVQIRFINDLQEPRRPPKARGKPGSYGVAVRVQGIAGQPFVVLNSGEKGGDSFGVQIKSEGSYPNPPAGPQPPGSISSDSDLPENPYVGRQLRHGSSHSTSDEETGGVSVTSRHEPQPPPGKRLLGEELRRTQSHGDLLSTADREPFAAGAPRPSGSRQQRALAGGKSSSMLNIAPERAKAPGLRATAKAPSSDTEAAVGDSDVDTKPLSSVDSLISKFDGKVQQRGRAARRGRIPSEERKRSQSLDGRVPHRDVPDAGELSSAQRRAGGLRPAVPAGSLGRPGGAAGMEDGGARSQRANRGAEEPAGERLQSKARAELQVPGGGGPILRGSQGAELFYPLKQLKSTPDLLRDQREVAQPGGSEHPKELIYGILKEGPGGGSLQAPPKDAACSQPQHRDLARKVEELQEKLDEETKLRQKLELSRDPGRSGTARGLESRLREAEGENQRLRGALEKKSQELQRSLQELSEARTAKEQAETRLGDCEEQLLATRRELDRLRKGSGAAAGGEALYKELLETREELEEALSSKQRQEEQLRLRERELTALKGALKEEVASHDKELDRVRQQYQSDMDQLRRSMEDMTQDQASLESERQKINTVVRNLQRELEESAEETGHWRDMFQKNKDELRTAKQELLQVKLEREEFEEELRELQERFAAAREDAEQARSSAADPGELEALRKELREAQRELAAEKRSREEQLRERERELAALKGTMREEASSHDGELERYRRDLQQLQEERDEATKAKASLESAREAAEQARKTVESSLREVQDQNDDLRRKILGMETQLKEYERLGENWEGSQARLKEKVTKLEAERRQMEESLGEATEREQELLMAKRSLETRLEEAQRGLARLTQEHQELSASYQEEQRQKEQLKRAKSELEEQKRLLDRTTEKLNKELEQMTEESHSSLAALKSQLEEFKEKSRKELTDSQKQAKDRGAEVEKMQFSVGRLQDEVARLKQALQDSQAERESALLDKEVLLQRLHNLEQEMDTKKRSQDDHPPRLPLDPSAPLSTQEKSKRLEVELDEERTTVELLTERVNRSRDQIDQLRAELLQERSSRQDLECDKVSLERQNKELKNRLASSEGLQKPSGNVSQLEARVEELQDRLQAEEREKSVLLSSNRKLERKVKELTIQIDDERQHVSDQKDQLSLRVKALKRQVDEAEEEIERLEGARKKAQRELEEQHELNEQLQNRIKALEKEAWRKAARSAADSSLQDDRLSSDEEFDSAYGPSSIASLLNEPNLQTSSC
ncbi:CING protein, partial [Rissa tridactyla]|nr:CING protein [Rissa tridactyla]